MLSKKEIIRQIRKHEYNIIAIAALIVIFVFLYSKFLTIGIPRDYTFPWRNNVNDRVETPWKL